MSSTAGPAGPDAVQRIVAVLVTDTVSAAAPPGVDAAEFARALVEDACDLVAELEFVTPAIVAGPNAERQLGGLGIEELAWPGIPVVRLGPAGREASPGADGSRDQASPRGQVAETLSHLVTFGAHQGAVLAADAPDLPPLLIGKLFRALGGAARRADVAVCPAEGGGLVAIAAWLPLAEWVAEAVAPVPGGGALELDEPDAVDRLRRAAQRRSAVQVVPGWHRLRSPAELSLLDPGLEGWAATRSVLHPDR